MSKIYICSTKGLEEVEILKETKCRYRVELNSQYLKVINKSELDRGHDGYVASLNKDRAITIWNDEINREIERLKGFLYTENI